MTLAQLAPWSVAIVGAGMLAIGVLLLVRAHRNPNSKIDLDYLLLDGSLNPPRLTQAKGLGLAAFLLSGWWVTWMVVNDKADATVVLGWAGIWGGIKVAGDVTALRERALTDESANAEAKRILGGA